MDNTNVPQTIMAQLSTLKEWADSTDLPALTKKMVSELTVLEMAHLNLALKQTLNRELQYIQLSRQEALREAENNNPDNDNPGPS